MDERVKKRLVGAVVLVSLAVIFVPMLLEERSPSRMPTFGSNVPPEPKQNAHTLDIPLQIPEAPPASRQTVVETESEAAELEQDARGENEPEPAPPEQAPEAASPEPVASRSNGKRKSKPAPTPQPKSESEPRERKAEPEGPKSWAVQVGSFSKSANAFRLRDKIREEGFPAFVEQLQTAERIIYRVRVGPEMYRDRADALRAELSERLELDGLVMTHP